MSRHRQEKIKLLDRCRICGNKNLAPILSLGNQALTGIFPKTREESVTVAPLELVKCAEDTRQACGLVQLRHSFDKFELYGAEYGYHSGLNRSMVRHLHRDVERILSMVSLEPQDMVLDIGSNDGTLLRAYPEEGLELVGIDPTGARFRESYPPHIQLIPDFFSAKLIRDRFGSKKAKIITSIAMFYDLDSPLNFVEQIRDILADDGVWLLEQSYLPTMIEVNAYDTICHEHLEYYRLKQIKWMTDRAGLKIIDLELNEVNGGSFSVMVAKADARYPECTDLIRKFLSREMKYSQQQPYDAFKDNVFRHREELVRFFRTKKDEGKKVSGYGASTKGNVILQFCGLTEEDISCIGEVNRQKFGRYTPGTLIPIVSEHAVKAAHPDYLVVFPWHFKSFFLKKEAEFMRSGGRLLFPLPRPEVC